jgi:phage terminase large subunit
VTSRTVAVPTRTIGIDLPEKLGFLLEMHPYKVVYGGRYGLKSHSCARALLALGANQRLRILCGREHQNSIDESVYHLLCSLIDEMDLGGFYRTPKTEIVGANGTNFSFIGLAEHTAHPIKSWEGADILWVEEGQAVSKRSWDMVIPTIRAKNSEIWVTFNPDMAIDDTYQRWVVNPPPGTRVVQTGWQDAEAMGWFPAKENEKRLHFKRTQPDDYDNIWEGVPRSVVAGAIYAKEIGEMIKARRIRPVPYDPSLPVHTIWDLGWNDAMAVIMVQQPLPSVVNVINYYEDNFRRYDEVVQLLNSLGYRWDEDWLPHDGESHNPQTGKSPKKTLQELGRKRVKIIGNGKRPDPEHGSGQVRMMFPHVYIDNSTLEHPTGYLGGQRLIDCLSRTARNVPKTTGEPAEQKRDEYKHGADAFRGLATIVDQLTNDVERRPQVITPAYQNADPGMGVLG